MGLLFLPVYGHSTIRLGEPCSRPRDIVSTRGRDLPIHVALQLGGVCHEPDVDAVPHGERLHLGEHVGDPLRLRPVARLTANEVIGINNSATNAMAQYSHTQPVENAVKVSKPAVVLMYEGEVIIHEIERGIVLMRVHPPVIALEERPPDPLGHQLRDV